MSLTAPAPGSGPSLQELAPRPRLRRANESLLPIRAPADSLTESYYEIDYDHVDLQGSDRTIHRLRFQTAEGWEFFDRWHYSW